MINYSQQINIKGHYRTHIFLCFKKSVDCGIDMGRILYNEFLLLLRP